jgi:hypothetical protein
VWIEVLGAGCRDGPLRVRQARAGQGGRSGRAPSSPGYRGALPGRSSCVRNAVTPTRSGRDNASGRSTVRRAQLLGGNRMTEKLHNSSSNSSSNTAQTGRQ